MDSENPVFSSQLSLIKFFYWTLSLLVLILFLNMEKFYQINCAVEKMILVWQCYLLTYFMNQMNVWIYFIGIHMCEIAVVDVMFRNHIKLFYLWEFSIWLDIDGFFYGCCVKFRIKTGLIQKVNRGLCVTPKYGYRMCWVLLVVRL